MVDVPIYLLDCPDRDDIGICKDTLVAVICYGIAAIGTAFMLVALLRL